MRRAGWAVWIAYDLPGSYEEMPPNLIDELKRDRRWCQGNLMNFRLVLPKGLHPAHRAVFMTGVMAYLSAPLWFLFLMLVDRAARRAHAGRAARTSSQPYQLFPLWPEWHPEWAIALFGATATLLFLPKILGVLLVAAQGPRSAMAARAAPGREHAREMVISALLAPIRMLFHTQFVVALIGWPVRWKSPPREDAEPPGARRSAATGCTRCFGVAGRRASYWLNPAFLWWLLPIVGALILSIPLSVYTSRVSLGGARAGRAFS